MLLHPKRNMNKKNKNIQKIYNALWTIRVTLILQVSIAVAIETQPHFWTPARKPRTLSPKLLCVTLGLLIKPKLFPC